MPLRFLQKLLSRLLPDNVAVVDEPIRLSDKKRDPDLACLCEFTPKNIDYGSSICDNTVDDKPYYDLQIIIPVYNTEQFLDDCMDSVLRQSARYKTLIVVVDDGSTDTSRDKLRKYETRPDVEIIYQDNTGQGGARNNALRHIHARYVMFVDSDDRLVPGAVDSLMDAAGRYDADIVEGNFMILRTKGLSQGKSHGQTTGNRWQGVLEGYPWGKVYCSELFRHNRFPRGYMFEDSLMSTTIYPLAKKIVTIHDNVYVYRINTKGSTFRSKGNPRSVESLLVTLQLLEDNARRGLKPDIQAYDSFLMSDVVNNFNICRTINNSAINHHVFSATCRIMKQYFSDYVANNTNRKLKAIEQALRRHDYRDYVVAILSFHA